MGKKIPRRIKIDDLWYDVSEGWTDTLNLRWGSGSDIRTLTAKEPYIHMNNFYFVYDAGGGKIGEFDLENGVSYKGRVTGLEM